MVQGSRSAKTQIAVSGKSWLTFGSSLNDTWRYYLKNAIQTMMMRQHL
jgi:hypothetical protein